MDINIFGITDPNIVGELLREICFVKQQPEDYGCYSTFDLTVDFQLAPDDVRKEVYDIFWPKRMTLADFDGTFDLPDGETPESVLARQQEELDSYDIWVDNHGITTAWFWDGDGTLLFRVKNTFGELTVINTDCKSPNKWRFVVQKKSNT